MLWARVRVELNLSSWRFLIPEWQKTLSNLSCEPKRAAIYFNPIIRFNLTDLLQARRRRWRRGEEMPLMPFPSCRFPLHPAPLPPDSHCLALSGGKNNYLCKLQSRFGLLSCRSHLNNWMALQRLLSRLISPRIDAVSSFDSDTARRAHRGRWVFAQSIMRAICERPDKCNFHH